MELILNLDFAILNFIQEHLVNPALDIFFPFFTKLGSGGVIWIAIALFLIFTKKDRKGGIIIIIALLLCLLVGNIFLKNLFQRPRPFSYVTGFNLLIDQPHDFSFPSGHTMSSLAAAYVLMVRDKKTGSIAMSIALIISYSRLYLYVHFPSDVLIGGILGIFLGYLAFKIYDKVPFFKPKHTL